MSKACEYEEEELTGNVGSLSAADDSCDGYNSAVESHCPSFCHPSF